MKGRERANSWDPRVTLPRPSTHKLSPSSNMTSGFRGQALCWITGEVEQGPEHQREPGSSKRPPRPHLLGVTEGAASWSLT